MLNIDPRSLSILRRHALDAYPYECCGVLLGAREGENRRVLHVVPCRNVHPTPKSRYAIDPAELIAVQRDTRDIQMEIVGFYHSHPDHSPEYSGTDLDEANWDRCSYLIIGLENRAIKGTKSYVLNVDGEQRFFVEELLSDAVHP